MERERAVPWESWQQWRHVRACIFSHSPKQIAHALDQVSAWQSRGGLPVAVEITAELISIHQRDPQMNKAVSPNVALPGEMLRMMYAMAIMRLVNGVVDQSMRRSTFSVANRAEDANLPRVFVDIRHETSHNELPSLPLVRHASNQALAWLQNSYWEEQEQLLPDTQGTLRSKLVEHAQMVFQMLAPQQKLLSKGQDYKKQRLVLKNAVKDMKRQQQKLLRELLELGTTSELVSLLVEDGLLVHNLNTPRDDEEEENRRFSDVDEAPDSPSSSNSDEGSTLDYSSAAWKHTFLELAEHLPQFPALLLSSICKVLITEEIAPSSFSREGLVEWATWILDQSSTSSSTKNKAGVGSVLFSQDALKEVAFICVRSGRLEKQALGEVVAHLAPLISDDCLRRRVEVLARCGDVESGSRSESEADSIILSAEFNVDTSSVKKARELQQISISKYLASLKKSTLPAASAGPWSKAKTWTPCAIGMLPSIGTEAVVPQFDVNQGSEHADVKRKAFELTPAVNLKRMRVQDQLMSEEEEESQTDQEIVLDTRGCEPMDEDEPLVYEDNEDEPLVDEEQAFVEEDQAQDADKFTVMWQGCLLQNGVLSQLQELPNLQAAIRVL